MKRSLRRAAGVTAVALSLIVLTGTAFADPGNGNSANAPGQEKKADEATPQAAPAATPDTAAQPAQQSTPPGQAKKQTASPGQAKQQARAANSTPGVKPSNTTSHHTSCTTGGSSSSATCTGNGPKADSSKQYGNGKTAAQIAVSRGAPAGTLITGPGNSQPHKVVTCGHKHAVDVHAVKSYDASACQTSTPASAAATAAVTPSSTSGQPGVILASSPAPSSATSPASPPAPASAAPSPASGQAASATPSTGGVLGATTTLTVPKRHAGGVLGAVTNIAGSSLPFTGFPLWIAVLTAVMLIAAGLVLRGRATATPA